MASYYDLKKRFNQWVVNECVNQQFVRVDYVVGQAAMEFGFTERTVRSTVDQLVKGRILYTDGEFLSKKPFEGCD
jgi:hypothetical protein